MNNHKGVSRASSCMRLCVPCVAEPPGVCMKHELMPQHLGRHACNITPWAVHAGFHQRLSRRPTPLARPRMCSTVSSCLSRLASPRCPGLASGRRQAPSTCGRPSCPSRKTSRPSSTTGGSSTSPSWPSTPRERAGSVNGGSTSLEGTVEWPRCTALHHLPVDEACCTICRT